jgi:hypothetical protein
MAKKCASTYRNGWLRVETASISLDSYSISVLALMQLHFQIGILQVLSQLISLPVKASLLTK